MNAHRYLLHYLSFNNLINPFIKIQNKEKAMQILRTRLHDMEYNRLHAERSATRADQVGSGERMEKIRTYNFAQNRVTDHRYTQPHPFLPHSHASSNIIYRVGVTSHALDKILTGEEIGGFIDEVVVHFEAKALEQLTDGGLV